MVSHNVRNVPVHRDKRTIEERHRDLVSSLRKKFGGRDRGAIKKTPDKSVHVHVHNPDWVDAVNRWLDETHDRWQGEMRRLQKDIFPLVPVDLFDVSPYDFFAPHGDVRSILDRMDRQMHALTQHMENTVAQDQLSIGADNGTIVPRSGGGLLNFLNNAYQPGEDGRVNFKARFDLKGYEPEDIQVTTSDNGLTVHAKKVIQTDQGSSHREYSRTLYLPKSIDRDQLQCHLTNDGILNVEAPVKPEEHKSLTYDRTYQLGIKPSSSEIVKKDQSGKDLAIQPTGVLGPSVLHDEKSGGEKLHVEIPVDPEFTADDLCVRMDDNRVILSGKKHISDETDTSKSTYIKEFSRSYDIPGTVDTMSVDAQLHEGKLLVEAPLLRPSISQ